MSNPNLSDLFLLDPQTTFLNHGSFGACPRPVFVQYQQWQRKLEEQPVKFLGRDLPGLLQEARQSLADFVGVERDELVFIPNATYGVNVISRALVQNFLQAGDEVLTTDHEYGACDRAWRYAVQGTGINYVRCSVPMPALSPAELVEHFWQAVTPHTKLIFLSHITSATAFQFPVEEICRRAKAANILTFIDGAHSTGQIPLNLTTLGADFYTSNCHKWLMSPKGCAFLYVQRVWQPLISPLIISWGWESESPSPSLFIDHHEILGTNDFAAYLSVPAAIQFFTDYQWHKVRQQCQTLAIATWQKLTNLLQTTPLYPTDRLGMPPQMFVVELPPCDLPAFKTRLYDQYQIEIPLIQWHKHQLLRLCVQGYNTPDQMDYLLQTLEECL